MAVDVVQTQNWGAIPIVVKTIPLGLVSLLLDLEVPIFVRSYETEPSIHPKSALRSHQGLNTSNSILAGAVIAALGYRKLQLEA